ncbi:MAG: MBL fold metallo-hydrolase [Desulfobacteraceae bacterium]|nr:MBL fold metallo-hydrolase [Desulfobacteraceae bacterium]MBC2720047.1 MBL fold metallo-hydrolase [Desulfobacteraceae bacterium]
MNIIHLGGENTVTGSCHLLQANGLNIMIDCGLVQGNDSVMPMKDWPVQPSEVDYLFLTHAHIDHIGRMPELIEKGFRGEIISSHPTKAIVAPMLEDAMGFTDITSDAAAKMSEVIEELSWGFEYNQIFDMKRGINFKLGRAGHILGSCWVQFDISDHMTVVFSGDLGVKDTPILCDPDVPEGCDLLILESTYGDRLHGDRRNRVRRLGKILTRALVYKGKILIPSFALGRTQELIYEMDRLFSDPELRMEFPELNSGPRIPVFLDSPLGLEITKIYSDLSEYWDKEAKHILRQDDHPIDFDHLYAVEGHRDHLKLCDMDGQAVIIAGSGMCTGGRILRHLKAGITDRKNNIFFVGYQAEGTPGKNIMRYSQRPGGYVVLDGEKLDIKARVHALSGYSAHADQKELLAWVASMPAKPGRIKLVHGEARAQNALGEKLLSLTQVL